MSAIGERLLGRIFWALMGILMVTVGGMIGGAFWLGHFSADFNSLQRSVGILETSLQKMVDSYEPRLRAIEREMDKRHRP